MGKYLSVSLKDTKIWYLLYETVKIGKKCTDIPLKNRYSNTQRLPFTILKKIFREYL